MGEDGAATDGRRKEIHSHSCRKKKHFLLHSPAYAHVHVFMHISVCTNIETNTVNVTAYEKSLRKQKLEAVIFSFTKK